MNVMLQFQEFTGLRIPTPPSVEKGLWPCFSTKFERDLSAAIIFRSFDILVAIISLSLARQQSATRYTQSQPRWQFHQLYILKCSFSSLMLSLACIFVSISRRKQWLMLTICKKDYAFAVFLDDKPRKSEYKP